MNQAVIQHIVLEQMVAELLESSTPPVFRIESNDRRERVGLSEEGSTVHRHTIGILVTALDPDAPAHTVHECFVVTGQLQAIHEDDHPSRGEYESAWADTRASVGRIETWLEEQGLECRRGVIATWPVSYRHGSWRTDPEKRAGADFVGPGV